MWSWLSKVSPCKTENTGRGYDQLYALYEWATKGTGGCPCCAFYRGLVIGMAVIWIIGKVL